MSLFMCEEGTTFNLWDISSIEPADREQEGKQALAVDRGELPRLWIVHHLSGKHKTEVRLSEKDLASLRSRIQGSGSQQHTTGPPAWAPRKPTRP